MARARILLAGDGRTIWSLAPWVPRLWPCDVTPVPGPDRLDGWAAILRPVLERVRPHTCVLVLGSGHADEPIAPAVSPVLDAVHQGGAALVWVEPPGLRDQNPEVAAQLEQAVTTAGDTYLRAPPLALDRGRLVPPAARRLLVHIGQTAPSPDDTSDLTDGFFRDGEAMGKRLSLDFVHLLMVMNVESNGVRAAAENPNSHAVGLIQFSNLAGIAFTGTRDEFKALGAQGQLPYVERHFAPYAGKHLDSAARVYQAVFLPATLDDPSPVVAAADGTRAWKNVKESDAYAANKGLDPDKTGAITLATLAKVVETHARSPRFLRILQRYSGVTGRTLPGVVPAAPSAAPSIAGPLLATVTVAAAAVTFLNYLEAHGARQRPLRTVTP